MVMDVMNAGGLDRRRHRHAPTASIFTATEGYVMAGMSPYQALRTATVNSAKALGLDAGTIEAGKLADLVMVEGNPLEHRQRAPVKRVIANGRLYALDELVTRAIAGGASGKEGRTGTASAAQERHVRPSTGS